MQSHAERGERGIENLKCVVRLDTLRDASNLVIEHSHREKLCTYIGLFLKNPKNCPEIIQKNIRTKK